jgi:hypothetical protein
VTIQRCLALPRQTARNRNGCHKHSSQLVSSKIEEDGCTEGREHNKNGEGLRPVQNAGCARLFLGYRIHPLSKGRISPPGISALGVALSWFGFDASELSRFTLILEQENSTGSWNWNEHNKKVGDHVIAHFNFNLEL